MNLNFAAVKFDEPVTRGYDWPMLWDIAFDPQCSVAEIRQQLGGEKWQPMNLGYGLENNSRRALLGPPFQSRLVRKIDGFFNHAAFKQTLIAELMTVPYFNNLWPTDKLGDITELTTLWGRDHPGFEISPHLDNRLQICTGMVFFNEESQPASGTQFTRTRGGPVIKTANSGFGQGWLLVHDYHGWHHGKNASKSDRYHLTFHLRIRI